MTGENNSLLEIRGLKTEFRLKNGKTLLAIDGIDLNIKPGEIHGLVGESGCGKTVASLSILRLITPSGYISRGNGMKNAVFIKRSVYCCRNRRVFSLTLMDFSI